MLTIEMKIVILKCMNIMMETFITPLVSFSWGLFIGVNEQDWNFHELIGLFLRYNMVRRKKIHSTTGSTL
jgi:hypothetical protein